MPFVCACGSCPPCLAGQHQVCDRQTQPGFTGWGSFAELVALDHADVNLVALPDDLSAATAAALGCRFATAYRAVVHQGRVRAGDWVAVHGCGGVGLSAVMIAVAAGARVVAVDVVPDALALARQLRRHRAGGRLDRRPGPSRPGRHGRRCRRVAGRAGQPRDRRRVGAQPGQARPARAGGPAAAQPPATGPQMPMARVIAHELEIVGSHGMAAHDYPAMLGLVASGRLRPDLLVTRTITLDEAAAALPAMGEPGFPAGVTVIQP